jgi:hypothetical protein
MPGTQAQKMSLVAPDLHEPPATTVTLGLGLALAFGLLAEPPLVVPLLPQAASSEAAATTASPAVSRAAVRVEDRERRIDDAPQGKRVDPDFGNISGCTP